MLLGAALRFTPRVAGRTRVNALRCCGLRGAQACGAVRARSRGAFGPSTTPASTLTRSMAAAGAGGAGGDGKPRLVIHLDVNKTVVLVDPAGGKSLTHVLNGLLADASWGRVDGEGASASWTLASEKLRVGLPPADAVADGASLPATITGGFAAGLCTYHHFVEEIALAYVDVGAAETPEAQSDAVKANRKIKRARNDLLLSFTDAGNPGERLRPTFERYLEAMTIPAAKKEAAVSASSVFTLGGSAADPKLFLLPAYFRLLQGLTEAGRDFTIVFRTFGDDGPRIVEEHNLFCRGEHPLFGGSAERYDGTGGSVDRVLKAPGGTGRIVRHTDFAGSPGSGIRLAWIDPDHGVIDTAGGVTDVFAAIHKLLGAGHRTLMLRDDYQYWHVNNERAAFGKLLLVDPSDLDEHHIFFDDNVGFPDTGMEIVDVRDARTGEELGYDDAIDVFVVKCQPTEAIDDAEYMLKRVATCEENRARRASGRK
mmetsp:Transcript_7564/g.26964  ORF Transcript_7564/g.26964 Transcript_7564/m.26964 type:complete len:483 (-) Transcript_7564:1154-2602(-)